MRLISTWLSITSRPWMGSIAADGAFTCRYILSLRLGEHGEAEESRVPQWVEQHVPGAELQQSSPGNISFSIAQQVTFTIASKLAS